MQCSRWMKVMVNAHSLRAPVLNSRRKQSKICSIANPNKTAQKTNLSKKRAETRRKRKPLLSRRKQRYCASVSATRISNNQPNRNLPLTQLITIWWVLAQISQGSDSKKMNLNLTMAKGFPNYYKMVQSDTKSILTVIIMLKKPKRCPNSPQCPPTAQHHIIRALLHAKNAAIRTSKSDSSVIS